MAVIHSRWALGQETTHRPQTAGAQHVTEFVYNPAIEGAITTAGNILELGILPAYAKITHASLAFGGPSPTGVTADVGIMTGEVGADLNPDGTARTVNSLLFNDADATILNSLSTAGALLLESSEKERSIGVTLTGATTITTGTIHLWLFYAQ